MHEEYLPIKLIICGEVEVGKTSICSRFTDEFTETTQPTIMPCFHKYPVQVQDKHLVFHIWDTAGSERYRSINTSYYRGAKAAVIVYDITNEQTWEEVKIYWQNQIKENGLDDAVVCIVGNKCDLHEKRRVDKEMAERYCHQKGYLLFETSATKEIGVKELFQTIIEKVANTPSLLEPKQNGKIQLIARREEPKVEKSCCK